jgi:hypothetical protein
MIAIVFSGRPTYAVYPVTRDGFVVGRGQDADLLILDPQLARHQLEVSCALVVRDLAGGATADGTPLTTPRRARIIRAGDTVLVLGDATSDAPLVQQVCDTLAREAPVLPAHASLIEAILLDPSRLAHVAQAARQAAAHRALRVEAGHLPA